MKTATKALSQLVVILSTLAFLSGCSPWGGYEWVGASDYARDEIGSFERSDDIIADSKGLHIKVSDFSRSIVFGFDSKDESRIANLKFDPTSKSPQSFEGQSNLLYRLKSDFVFSDSEGNELKEKLRTNTSDTFVTWLPESEIALMKSEEPLTPTPKNPSYKFHFLDLRDLSTPKTTGATIASDFRLDQANNLYLYSESVSLNTYTDSPELVTLYPAGDSLPLKTISIGDRRDEKDTIHRTLNIKERDGSVTKMDLAFLDPKLPAEIELLEFEEGLKRISIRLVRGSSYLIDIETGTIQAYKAIDANRIPHQRFVSASSKGVTLRRIEKDSNWSYKFTITPEQYESIYERVEDENCGEVLFDGASWSMPYQLELTHSSGSTLKQTGKLIRTFTRGKCEPADIEF